MKPFHGRVLLFFSCLILYHPLTSSSYALLAHEAIIDATWDNSIKPLLKQKYPDATPRELKKAHAFVYGGTVIPDLGYYPFGRHIFSDMVHYVRTGDFIDALLDESRDINEYAFALGVLCHYEADCYGHSLCTNKAVPLLFPRLRKKYGDVVTYEEGEDEHTRVEFGFDVLQTAEGNYKPDNYHDFIGFEVSDSLLERAFLKTYGVSIKTVFHSLPSAIAIYRLSVKSIVPELTRDAWKINNSFITKLNPLATKENYRYKVNKKVYRKEFKQPKVQSILVMIVIGALPKYGPFAKFKPAVPSPECEKLFKESFKTILVNYSAAVKKLQAGKPSFHDMNMDTGQSTAMNQYHLADKTYYRLVMKLKRHKFDNAEPDLKQNILAYYTDRNASSDYKADTHKGKKLTKALNQMEAAPAESVLK